MASRVELPIGSSTLTANPYDELETLEWVELATEESGANPSAFWHAMGQFTRELHWNKSFFDISITAEALHSLPNKDSEVKVGSVKMPCIGASAPPEGYRYVALRSLARKIASPIGGGAYGLNKSYVCEEWTVQYITKNVHTAIFGLVIPENILGPENPRAMTYWPFHYPKCRAYRYTYSSGKLQYDVVPLRIAQTRTISNMVKHIHNAAKKNLIQVRKRMTNFDPIRGISTYTKRVHHDKIVAEIVYRKHYNRIRDKYSYWVEIWNFSEVTDPLKFVFEEMCIAAYLCALWEQERRENNTSKLQTFLDCGCGNGFLVYLLISEGYSGVGIDLQRRRIWNRYPKRVTECLRHEQIEPANFLPDQKFDWIIGNHSDELTPWLPIFAARAQQHDATKSLNAAPKLFILPCCFFDFDAKKLAFSNNRRTVPVLKGDGKYDQYVTWIMNLCKALGFGVTLDTLRIPSTKNRALICTSIERPQQLDRKVIEALVKLFTLDAQLSRG